MTLVPSPWKGRFPLKPCRGMLCSLPMPLTAPCWMFDRIRFRSLFNCCTLGSLNRMESGTKFRIGRLSSSVKRWSRGAFLRRSGLRIPKNCTPRFWSCLSLNKSALLSLSRCWLSSVSEEDAVEFVKLCGAAVELCGEEAEREEVKREEVRGRKSTNVTESDEGDCRV